MKEEKADAQAAASQRREWQERGRMTTAPGDEPTTPQAL